jgi:hypothetical protein
MFKEYLCELLEDYTKREAAMEACSKAELRLSELRARRQRALQLGETELLTSLDDQLEHGLCEIKQCMRTRLRIEGAMSFNLISINKLARLKLP